MFRDQGAGALLLVHHLIVGRLNRIQLLVVSRRPKGVRNQLGPSIR
jgi:hypothetical protein